MSCLDTKTNVNNPSAQDQDLNLSTEPRGIRWDLIVTYGMFSSTHGITYSNPKRDIARGATTDTRLKKGTTM
jgi:hypothetical protein